MEDFNYDRYVNIYPPYEYILRDVEDTSVFAFIRRDLQRIKNHIGEIYSALELIRNLTSYTVRSPYILGIYKLLDKIKGNIQILRDIVGDIRLKIKAISKEGRIIDYYLNRIQIEILDEIESLTDSIKYKIRGGYDILNDLFIYERKVREKLIEFERFVDEIYMHI